MTSSSPLNLFINKNFLFSTDTIATLTQQKVRLFNKHTKNNCHCLSDKTTLSVCTGKMTKTQCLYCSHYYFINKIFYVINHRKIITYSHFSKFITIVSTLNVAADNCLKGLFIIHLTLYLQTWFTTTSVDIVNNSIIDK